MATPPGSAATGTTKVVPITESNAQRVGEFLHANMNPDIPVDVWVRSLRAPWDPDAECGVALVDGEQVVGAYVAYPSEREIDGRAERMCNLGTWCVLPSHRAGSLGLLKALLDDGERSFVDLSPAVEVVAIDERLGFESLETSAWTLPNVPVPYSPRRTLISSEPRVLERILSGRELEIYRDHASAQAALHFVLARKRVGYCYVVARQEMRRGMPVLVLLYVSAPDLYRDLMRAFGTHLLLRHRIVAQVAEERLVGERPALARETMPEPRLFRSGRLAAEQIDYLYSELVCLPA